MTSSTNNIADAAKFPSVLLQVQEVQPQANTTSIKVSELVSSKSLQSNRIVVSPEQKPVSNLSQFKVTRIAYGKLIENMNLQKLADDLKLNSAEEQEGLKVLSNYLEKHPHTTFFQGKIFHRNNEGKVTVRPLSSINNEPDFAKIKDILTKLNPHSSEYYTDPSSLNPHGETESFLQGTPNYVQGFQGLMTGSQDEAQVKALLKKAHPGKTDDQINELYTALPNRFARLKTLRDDLNEVLDDRIKNNTEKVSKIDPKKPHQVQKAEQPTLEEEIKKLQNLKELLSPEKLHTSEISVAMVLYQESSDDILDDKKIDHMSNMYQALKEGIEENKGVLQTVKQFLHANISWLGVEPISDEYPIQVMSLAASGVQGVAMDRFFSSEFKTTNPYKEDRIARALVLATNANAEGTMQKLFEGSASDACITEKGIEILKESFKKELGETLVNEIFGNSVEKDGDVEIIAAEPNSGDAVSQKDKVAGVEIINKSDSSLSDLRKKQQPPIGQLEQKDDLGLAENVDSKVVQNDLD